MSLRLSICPAVFGAAGLKPRQLADLRIEFIESSENKLE